MFLDRLDRQTQLARRALVRLTERNTHYDFALATCDQANRGVFVLALRPVYRAVQRCLGERFAKEPLTGRDGAQCLEQFRMRRIFEQKSARSHAHRGTQEILAVKRRENQDRSRAPAFAQASSEGPILARLATFAADCAAAPCGSQLTRYVSTSSPSAIWYSCCNTCRFSFLPIMHMPCTLPTTS